ncbi:MAG: trigger factor [Pseudomonadales bacterium]
MQVDIETTQGLERRMRVVVPFAAFKDQIDASLKKTAKTVRLKGFRPGKVPIQEIERRYGTEILQDVSTKVIQSSCFDAFQQEDISPAGQPDIVDVKCDPGQDLEYTAVFEVLPEVNLGKFKKVKVVRPVCEVTEADIDQMVETLRQQRVGYHPVDRPSAKEDRLTLDRQTFVADVQVEEEARIDEQMLLGQGTPSLLPEVAAALTGMAAGDRKEVTATLPENFHLQPLAGKQALFKLHVKEVAEPVLPPMNDSFFALFDVKEGGLDAFRQEVRTNMERELKAIIKTKVTEQVLAALVRQSEFATPQRLVREEAQRIWRGTMAKYGIESGGDVDLDSMGPATAEPIMNMAQSNVQRGLLVGHIIRSHEVEVDADKVNELIKSTASTYADPEEVARYYRQNQAAMNSVQEQVLSEQVVELVLASAKVTEKQMTYEETVNYKPPGAEDTGIKGLGDRDADARDADAKPRAKKRWSIPNIFRKKTP